MDALSRIRQSVSDYHEKLDSVTIEDAEGNTRYEIIDVIKPLSMKEAHRVHAQYGNTW